MKEGSNIVLIFGLLALGCGDLSDFLAQRTQNQTQAHTASSDEESPFLSISVGIARKGASLSFSLAANASSFTVNMANCASGFTSTADAQSLNLQVYRDDESCLAKLTTFTLNGFTYVPSSGDPFTTWGQGDTAIFEVSADPSNNLLVSVTSTLSNPIQVTDTVYYEFSKIGAGANKGILSSVVGFTETLIDQGQTPPPFTILKTQLLGETAGKGGQWVYTLECTAMMSGTDCGGVDLSVIRYKLVQDTYNSDLTLVEAAAIFASGSSSIAIGTEDLAPGAGGTTNGGFFTKTLSGPDNLHTNNTMILILVSNVLSYKYFNVDVVISN